MKLKHLLLLSLTLVSFSLQAAEDVTIDFEYTGNVNADLSAVRAPIKIGEFTDGRSGDNPRLIAGDYQAETALADIIRDAMAQGFSGNGAELTESDDGVQIVGNIESSRVQTVDRGGVETTQLDISLNIQLRDGARTIWQVTLFGRGRAPATEGIVSATHASLDRMIRELLNDDYFLAEIL